MFSKKILAWAGVLACATALIGAPALASLPLKPCEGTSTGKWDLPTPWGPAVGYAAGDLISYGFLLYSMEAKLIPSNVLATQGTIEGRLTSHQSWLPDATIKGEWYVTSNGTGEFKAEITIPGWSPGWMKGKFDDPPSNPGSGVYKAEFAIC